MSFLCEYNSLPVLFHLTLKCDSKNMRYPLCFTTGNSLFFLACSALAASKNLCHLPQAPEPTFSQPEVKEESAPPAPVPAKEEPAADLAPPEPKPDSSSTPDDTSLKNHEPHLGPKPRSHNRVLNPPGGKSSVVFY